MARCDACSRLASRRTICPNVAWKEARRSAGDCSAHAFISPCSFSSPWLIFGAGEGVRAAGTVGGGAAGGGGASGAGG